MGGHHHYGAMKNQAAQYGYDGAPQQSLRIPASFEAPKKESAYLSPREYDMGSQPDTVAANPNFSETGAPHHPGLGRMKATVGVVLGAAIGNDGLEPKTPKFIVGKNKVPDAVTQRVVAALNL